MNRMKIYEPVNLLNEFNSLWENLQKRQDDSQVATSHWLPAVDIKEEQNQFIILADLPGVDPKDIEVSMDKNILTLKGTRETKNEENRETYHRVERAKGQFYRRFTLPDTADGTEVQAKSKQGVLEIIIPKKQASQARKIEIQLAE